MKENSFTLAKARSRWYSAQTITDAHYANDIALQANTPALAASLVHSLEWPVGSRSLHVNADKTEFMSFNQWDDVSSPNGGSLKLVDKFTYFGSSVSSTENDINTRLANHGQLSIGYWSYGSQVYPIKENAVFPSSGRVITTTWMHHMYAD